MYKRQEYTVAVLDLGGGTFDVTIMEMDNGVFDVISTSGDNNLGGTDMDDALVDYLADLFKEENGIEIFSLARISTLVDYLDSLGKEHDAEIIRNHISNF